MELELMPELGIEITPDMAYVDLRERAEAACRSIELLQDHGLEIPPETSEDKEVAAALTTAYAANPQATSQKANNVNTSALMPASLQNIRTYLDEYGRAVVNHAVEIRHAVTNRLIEESINPDPRIRIRALELLGKISDVGLFTDRTEITITHQTTDELRLKLRAKLQRLIAQPEIQDAEVVLGGEIVDVDRELGLNPPETPVKDENSRKNVEISEIEGKNTPFDDDVDPS
jgi:antitoxin component HigA of HigAB toxin-antitoxin module